MIGLPQLISNLQVIARETGLRSAERFLYPALALDAQRVYQPFLLKTEGQRVLLINAAERGNFSLGELIPTVKVRYLGYYFTFDDADDWPGTEFCSAIAEIIGEAAELEVDADLVVGYYFHLRQQQRVVIHGRKEKDAKVHVYSIPTTDVTNRFTESRRQLEPFACLVAAELNEYNDIVPYLEVTEDNRFSLLDKLMTEQGLDALWLSSSLNLQEVTGLGFKTLEPKMIGALYVKGSDEIYLVCPEFIPEQGWRYLGRFCLAGFLRQQIGETASLGIEEENLTLDAYLALQWPEEQVGPATALLRQWREERTGDDLLAYILCSVATRRGIENALAWAEEAIGLKKTITEADVANRFRAALDAFQTEHRLPAFFRTEFIVIHSGTRTYYPAHPAADYGLSKHINSLKIDAGVSLVNAKGILLGCSDLARTSVFTTAGEKIYALENRAIQTMLSNAKAGMTGEDVYLIGLSTLVRHQSLIEKVGLIPPNFSLFRQYHRHMGHILGKQEKSRLTFRRGNHIRLKPGMIGCAEIHWPYRQHCIAFEDMFLVTPAGLVNITC
ncbi:MAG: M24 family metallopeptidase [Firmicutes bacterium]|nr:M24 family metallopeptidase [Bacillota bacterium]